MFEVQMYNDGWLTDSIGDSLEWLKEYMRDVPTSFRIVKGNQVHLFKHKAAKKEGAQPPFWSVYTGLRAIIFDFDGTIADTFGLVEELTKDNLKSHNIPISPEEAKRSIPMPYISRGGYL